MTSRRGLWMVVVVVGLVPGCSDRPRSRPGPDAGPVAPEPVVYEATEGVLRGLRMEVPDGAYEGAEPLTMEPADAIPLDEIASEGQALSVVSPAVEFGPPGTRFAEPVTIGLPFSVQAYNDADVQDKQIAVVNRRNGSTVGFDVGPVALEAIDFGRGNVGFDVGPVAIGANEGNAENDALLEFQTDHFSSYQVVVVGSPPEPDPEPCDCGRGEVCVDNQCVGCSQWQQVSAGDYHTCGVYGGEGEGDLYCWGDNGAYQLGRELEPDEVPISANAPAQAGAGVFWRSVAAGAMHTCAINEEGSLYCWGVGGHGRLGIGHEGTERLPILVGREDMREKRWKSVSLGTQHTCAIDDDLAAWCWGDNTYGALGHGSVGLEGSTRLPERVLIEPETRWESIAAGPEHSCGLTMDGELYCWGRNGQRQVSGEETDDIGRPFRMLTIQSTLFGRVATGLNHTCAISLADDDCDALGLCAPAGTLYCWGGNGHGQLGIGQEGGHAAPTSVTGPETTWIEVGAGTHSTCALLEEGAGEDSLWCWGNNASQQLIQALDAAGKYNLPVQVPGDHQWAPLRRVDDSRRPGQMNGGSGHFCALYAEGEVTSLFCAGSNSAGQLGVVSEERVVGNVVCPISPEPGEGEGGGEGEGEGREPGCQEDLEQCLSVCRRKCDSNTSPYGICVDHCNGGQVDLVGYGECMLSIDCNVEGSGGDRWDWSVLENCAADNPRQAEDPCE